MLEDPDNEMQRAKLLHDIGVEFFDLNGLMRSPLGDRFLNGHSRTVSIQLEVPEEWAMLAAWLEMKTRMRRAGQAGRCEFDGLAQAQEASDYMLRIIGDDLRKAFGELGTGRHVLLHPSAGEG